MNYKRLARSRGLGRFHSLWLGEDHLLAVEATGYSEEYTRYYLKDIQAIITRRSVWGKVLNAITGSLAALSLLTGIGAYEKGPSPVSITAGIFGGFFLILLLWNLFRGPTCYCQIRTSVGIDDLPALKRIKSVRKVLDRLRPQIGRLQGGITIKEIVELTGIAKGSPPAVFPAGPASKVADASPPVEGNISSPYRGSLAKAVFLLLIADAGISFLQTLHNSKPLVILSTFVGIAFLCLAIIVLVRRQAFPLASPAKWLTWGGLAAMMAGSVTGYFFMIFLNFNKFKGGFTTQDQIIDFYATIEPADHPTYATFILVYAVITAIIGIAGLIALGREGCIAERRSQ
jgi:hypothetical protein